MAIEIKLSSRLQNFSRSHIFTSYISHFQLYVIIYFLCFYKYFSQLKYYFEKKSECSLLSFLFLSMQTTFPSLHSNHCGAVCLSFGNVRGTDMSHQAQHNLQHRAFPHMLSFLYIWLQVKDAETIGLQMRHPGHRSEQSWKAMQEFHQLFKVTAIMASAYFGSCVNYSDNRENNSKVGLEVITNNWSYITMILTWISVVKIS